MSNLLNDQNGKTSGKRIAGCISLGMGLVMLGSLFCFALVKKVVDSETAMTCAKTAIFTGAGLLGLGVVEFFGTKK